MRAFISDLVEKADLTEEQADKVAGVLRDFLDERLPEMVRGPVLAALSGDNIDSGADVATNLLGGLFK